MPTERVGARTTSRSARTTRCRRRRSTSRQGPSHDIVAPDDNTTVTMRPKSRDRGGRRHAGRRGERSRGRSRSTRASTRRSRSRRRCRAARSRRATPVGVFGGHQIMSIDRCCGDHGEQMLAPVSALGNEYVAAPHADREPGSTDPRVYPDLRRGRRHAAHLRSARASAPATVEPRPDRSRSARATPFTVKQPGHRPPVRDVHVHDRRRRRLGLRCELGRRLGRPRLRAPRAAAAVPRSLRVLHRSDVSVHRAHRRARRRSTARSPTSSSTAWARSPRDWQPVGTTADYEIAYVKLVDHFNGQNGCNNGVNIDGLDERRSACGCGAGAARTRDRLGQLRLSRPAKRVLPINDVVIQ